MENPLNEKSKWIQELSNQSWNLELVISGAAIFSTSFLPKLTDNAIEFYYQNFQLSNDLYDQILPTLSYSFGKSAAYLLIITFALHFILRAFWIAIVGLRAVYPQGINFENIPNTNKQLSEIYKNKFGSLDDYIVRLDKFCSQIFSIAFVLVLFNIMISLMYIITFIGTIGIKTYFPSFYYIVKPFFIFLMVAVTIYSLIIMFLSSKEKYREQPLVAKLAKQFIQKSTWIYFGLYKPMQYINFTFGSNMSHKKYFRAVGVLGLTFFMLSITIYTFKLFGNVGLTILESRNYYSSGSTENKLETSYYDSQRSENESISEASIQSDVIEEPFVKLFINYNKAIDNQISNLYKEPTFPDSLKNSKKRILKDKARIECFAEYFQISINDSVLNQVEYFFGEHQSAKGLKTYIDSENCKIGRNTIYIKTMVTDSLPKKIWKDYVAIPFWFAENIENKHYSRQVKITALAQPPKVRTRKNGISIPTESSKEGI